MKVTYRLAPMRLRMTSAYIDPERVEAERANECVGRTSATSGSGFWATTSSSRSRSTRRRHCGPESPPRRRCPSPTRNLVTRNAYAE